MNLAVPLSSLFYPIETQVIAPSMSTSETKYESEAEWTSEHESEAEWTPGEEEPIAVDITYCNPAAKVILISSDKVEMRVDAWHMSRHR
jgi:hypothetical protein